MKLKMTTAILIGIAVVALLFFMNGAGMFNPKSQMTLVYDSGAGSSQLYSQNIVVGTGQDITNDAVKYGSGQIDKIVADLHCDCNVTVSNAQPTDTIKLTFTASYGSATYGSGGITLYTYSAAGYTDQMSYTVTLSGSQFQTTKSMIVSADSIANLWGREYVRCYDLLTGIQLQPWGTVWTLRIPVSISVQAQINGNNQQPAPAANIAGTTTVTVNGGSTTLSYIVTSASVSSNYVALNIIAH